MIGFACGGTGGHVYPAIAVAQTMPSDEVIFFGSTDREDRTIIPRYGFAFEPIPSSNRNPLVLLLALVVSVVMLRKKKVKTLYSTGGYLTAPVIMAAWLCRIPVILMEQNVLPGRVNRAMQRFASEIHLSFDESKPYFSASLAKVKVTGNPVRSQYLEDEVFHAFKALRLPDRPIALVFGGSLAAHAINTLLFSHREQLFASAYTIVHIVGGADFNVLKKTYPVKNHMIVVEHNQETRLVYLPYIEHMKLLYDRADVVLCRAGATSIAELLAYHKPAVLVPYPYARDDHQRYNAEAFCKRANGELLFQNELTVETLLASWDRLRQTKA